LPTKSPAYWRHRRYRIAIAQGLVEFGATVSLSSPREAKINKCIQSILSDHPFAKGRVFGYPCDLSSQQVETNLEQLFEKVGTVNHIIFMAGERLQTVPLEEIKLEKMQKTFHSRTFAARDMLRKIAHHSSHSPQGQSAKSQSPAAG
jgi:NAD(P)-dependent dehydrogenase (short-subunit alcohol dehydrogenase family)